MSILSGLVLVLLACTTAPSKAQDLDVTCICEFLDSLSDATIDSCKAGDCSRTAVMKANGEVTPKTLQSITCEPTEMKISANLKSSSVVPGGTFAIESFICAEYCVPPDMSTIFRQEPASKAEGIREEEPTTCGVTLPDTSALTDIDLTAIDLTPFTGLDTSALDNIQLPQVSGLEGVDLSANSSDLATIIEFANNQTTNFNITMNATDPVTGEPMTAPVVTETGTDAVSEQESGLGNASGVQDSSTDGNTPRAVNAGSPPTRGFLTAVTCLLVTAVLSFFL